MSATDQLEHMRLAAEVAGFEGLEPVLPAEHQVEVGDLSLHYVDWGGAEWSPIVFLHGGGLTARTWDLVCLALRSTHRCLALDQRGHGDSDWSDELDYDVDTHARDLDSFIRKLDLERPVLVGQSMGGLSALTYAAQHAPDVAALALIDMVLAVRIEGAKRIADFMRTPAELDRIEDFIDLAVGFNPARDPRLLRRSLLHNLRRLPNGKWTWKYDQRAMTGDRLERTMAHVESLRGQLHAVTCPTLVVHGADSDLVTEDAARELARALPLGDWTTVPDAGHTVQGDNARGLVEALHAFLP